MRKKATIKEVSEEEEVISLSSVDEGEQPVVVGGEAHQDEPELVENDVFGIVKEKKAAKLNDLRSKDLDSSLLEVEKAGKAEIEDEWESSKGRVWSLWMVLTSVVLLALIGGGVIWAVSRLEDGGEKEMQAEQALEKRLFKDEKKALSAAMLVEKIESATRGFCEASSVEEMLPFVRDSERVEPLMRGYYKDKKLLPGKLEKVVQHIPVELENRIFWMVSYRLEGRAEPEQLLMMQGDQEVKVDWESKVVHQPNDWVDFRKEREVEATLFRVYMEKIEEMAFYGYEFSDYKKYRCFKITVKDQDGYLWGYSEIGSELDGKLMELFKEGGAGSGKAPAIIEIRYLKDSMSGMCVKVESLLSESWISLE